MRLVCRALTSLTLAVSLMLLGTPAAAFEVDWCAADPVFTVDGTTFRLTAYWPSEQNGSVQGVTYLLTVSQDASVSYTIPPGETTNVTVVVDRSGNPSADHVIKASVTVHASASFRTKVEMETARGAHATHGQANRPMRVLVPAAVTVG